MEKILARRFAPFNFSAIPGFPNVVPSPNEWSDYLPIFRERKEDNPAQHLREFHELMHQWEIHHEDVLLKMFMFSLAGDAREWYHSLPPASISSLSEFHAAFNRHYQKFYSSEFICHSCCEECEDSEQDMAVSHEGCEDKRRYKDEDPGEEEDALGEVRELVKSLSAQLDRWEVERCAEDFPAFEEDALGISTMDDDEDPREEEDALSKLMEQVKSLSARLERLESEDNVEDFPVLEADVLGGSFEEDIEDFIAVETLVSAPDEPVVSDLKEEAMVEMDCSLFLHEISHDVFTFGVEMEDREIVPFLQDGGVLFSPSFDDYLEEEQQSPTSQFADHREASLYMTTTNQILSWICWISKSRLWSLILCSLKKIIMRKSTILRSSWKSRAFPRVLFMTIMNLTLGRAKEKNQKSS
jgi:hypothetical protein